MDTKLKESKRDLTDARRSCDDLLKSKKADLEKLTKEYSNEKAEILRKMDALSADVTRSNASVKDQQAKFSTLESAHSTLTTKFSSAEAEWNLERQTLETNIETWSNKVSSLSLERDAATEKVVKLEAANLSLQSQIEQLEKVQALDPSNIQQLVADNDDLKAQLSAAKDEALAQMNLIASLEQKVVGKEDAVSLLTKDKQQLAESIADLRANVDDMEKRLSVQTSQLDQTKGSLLNSEMSREEAQGKLERLQSDVSAAEEELAKRISSLEQERQQLIDTVSVLKNQASAFAEEKKKLSEQVSDLQTQLENSLHGNSSLTTQVDILNNRISQIMSQIETLEQLNSTVLREKEQGKLYLVCRKLLFLPSDIIIPIILQS